MALKAQLDKDELAIIEKLASMGSESGEIITRLRLCKEIVTETMLNLSQNRRAQENLASILAATRYKFYYKGELYPVECPKGCGQADSYSHMLQCYDLEEKEQTGTNATEFLVEMALRTIPSRKGPPTPIFARETHEEEAQATM